MQHANKPAGLLGLNSPRRPPIRQGTNQMSFATSLARLRGSIGIAALASMAAWDPAWRRTMTPPAQTGPAPPGPATAGSARATGPARSGSAAPVSRRPPRLLQVKPEPSQSGLDQGLRQGSGANAEVCYTTRDFGSDQGQPVLAVRLRRQGPRSPRRSSVPDADRLAAAAGRALRRRPGSADARPLRICFPNGCFAEAPGLKDDVVNQRRRARRQRERAEPSHARGHLRGSAGRVRQGLRRGADRSEIAGGAAKEAQEELQIAPRGYAPAPQTGPGAPATPTR